MLLEFALGLLLGAIIGGIGYRLNVFAGSGIIALTLASGLVFGAGGWVWGAGFLFCFLSSSLWIRYRSAYKEHVTGGLGRARSTGWSRILAQAGWGVILALLHRLAPRAGGLYVAFIGAMAGMTADIWATELGLLSTRAPRSITNWRRVAAGTAGAVSALGLVAALSGAWLVGFVGLSLAALRAWLLNAPWDRTAAWLPLSAALAGFAGSLVDSLLGGTAQGMYYCERCEKETENRRHACGELARQIRGWAWLTNDMLDFVGSLVGAAVAAGIVLWLAQTTRWW